MRPTNLAVRGLKSWDDFDLPLERLTAIQGPNGAGKTALIQALRLSILGYDPETGKQLAATRKLVNEIGEADIAVSFDTGFAIRRKFGEKTTTQVMPSEGEGSGRECQQRIDKETGGLVVALDVSEVLSLSDEKRREWFFQHLPRESASLDWDTFKEWTGSAEGLEDVVENLWMHSVQKAPNPVIGLGNAIEVAHRDFLEADRLRQVQETVTARAEERFRALDKPDEPDAEKSFEAVELVASLNQRIGQARKGREARQSIEDRVETQTAAIEELERRKAHLSQVLADQKEQLEAITFLDETTDVTDKLGDSDSVYASLDNFKTETGEKLAALRAKVLVVTGRLQGIKEHGPCPHASHGCTTDLDAIMGTAEHDATAELEGLNSKIEEVALAETDLFTSIAELKASREEWRTIISAASAVRAKHRQLSEAIETKEVQVAELQERLNIGGITLAATNAELADIAEDDGLASLFERREKADEFVLAFGKAREDLAAYQAIKDGLKQERAELEAKTARAKALKGLDANLRRLRGHVIEQMIAPLQSEANEILQAIDPAKEFRFVFERENKAVMDFGFEEGGVLRFYDAASKGERVMLIVAFLGAILTIVKPAMRLLVIDDIEQLWPANRERLLRALAEMKDRWDAIIVAGACELGGVEDWHVVNLEEAA